MADQKDYCVSYFSVENRAYSMVSVSLLAEEKQKGNIQNNDYRNSEC